jgi:hypothetical protein
MSFSIQKFLYAPELLKLRGINVELQEKAQKIVRILQKNFIAGHFLMVNHVSCVSDS